MQRLACELAIDFAHSVASSSCWDALQALLPRLTCYSIAVHVPSLGDSLVISTIRTAGPTTLHLHDGQMSAAGAVLASGKLMQLDLAGAEQAVAALAYTDVQQVLEASPASARLLCIPFGEQAAGEDAALRCPRHSDARGALLLGFSTDPDLDVRRATALASLIQQLPAALGSLSADTLAFVEYACGSLANAATCCCCADEEEEGEEHGGGTCRPARYDDAGGSSGAAAAAPKPSPEPVQPALAEVLPDQPGPSKQLDPPSKLARMAGAATVDQTLTRSEPSDPAWKGSFSKAALADVLGSPGEAFRQQPITLAFRSAAVEQQYATWMAAHYLKMDRIFFMLLISAVGIVSFAQPFCLIHRTPRIMGLGLGLALLLSACSALSATPRYPSWRLCLVAAVRLYVVMLAGVPPYQAGPSPAVVGRWLSMWRLSGAEAMFATAVGLLVGVRQHLLLQLASMAISAFNIPSMCAENFPHMAASSCVIKSTVVAATFGCMLPTGVLRYMEHRSRSKFAQQLRAAAASAHLA